MDWKTQISAFEYMIVEDSMHKPGTFYVLGKRYVLPNIQKADFQWFDAPV